MTRRIARSRDETRAAYMHKAQFLKEIEEDEEKREQYEFTKNVKKAFESRGDKLKAMTEFQKEYETRDDKSNFRKKLVWFSGIAAVLVIGFFVINPLFVLDMLCVRTREDDLQNGKVFQNH